MARLSLSLTSEFSCYSTFHCDAITYIWPRGNCYLFIFIHIWKKYRGLTLKQQMHVEK